MALCMALVPGTHPKASQLDWHSQKIVRAARSLWIRSRLLDLAVQVMAANSGQAPAAMAAVYKEDPTAQRMSRFCAQGL